MSRVRVLVVEDSITIRQRLCEILTTDPAIEVVGEAGDGRRAIELCRELRPAVITLDMMLPVMSGLAATEYVMAHFPTPILIVSSSTNRGEVFKTFEALAAGAVDVMEKPRGDEREGQWERAFIDAVKLVSRIKVITHPRATLEALRRVRLPPSPSSPGAAAGPIRLIALGASTGGPGALVEILQKIPLHSGVPVLITVHISDPFAAAFADWLDGQSQHRVRYALDGESLAELGGRVLLAPPGRHLVVRAGRVHLTADPERHSCRPSVDVLFESLASELRDGVAAALLTGMGRDGAAGLAEIRRAGGVTIAQDEATSVVWGMPREAVLIDAAARVLPLHEIGPALAELVVGHGLRGLP